MSFVRTVLGDIDPADPGVTYAHEHIVIYGGRPVLLEPGFDLSVDAVVRRRPFVDDPARASTFAEVA